LFVEGIIEWCNSLYS